MKGKVGQQLGDVTAKVSKAGGNIRQTADKIGSGVMKTLDAERLGDVIASKKRT